MSSSSPELGSARTAPLRLTSRPPFTRTSTARARWSFHATSRATSRPEMAGLRCAAPPRRHGRRPARSQAPPALPLALSCPPWHGGHVGGDLVVGHLADGELTPVNAASPAAVAGRWGRLTRGGPCVSSSVRPWVHCTGCTQRFKARWFFRNKRNDFQILFKHFGN